MLACSTVVAAAPLSHLHFYCRLFIEKISKVKTPNQLSLQLQFVSASAFATSLCPRVGLKIAMNSFEELERMAINTTSDSQLDEDEPCEEDIARWQRLFSYAYSEAKEKIEKHRSDLARERVSKDLWTLLQPQFEGYDREAYEHSLTSISSLSFSKAHSDQESPQNLVSETYASFLFRMESPLEQADVILEALGSNSAPEFKHGWVEDGEASFCQVESAGKAAIEGWLSQQRSSHRPVFVRESLARKDLSGISIHPFLGIDATLPQHRLTTLKSIPKP